MTERTLRSIKNKGVCVTRPLMAATLALSGAIALDPTPKAHANHQSCEQNGRLIIDHQAEGNLDCALAQTMLDLHNVTRNQHGLQSLSVDPILTRAAESYAQWLLNPGVPLSHDGQGGTWRRMEAHGFKIRGATGENLASGSDVLPPKVHFQALMDSYGHRVNILQPTYNIVGVGMARRLGEARYVIMYSERPNYIPEPTLSVLPSPAFYQEPTPIETAPSQPPLPTFAAIPVQETSQPINPYTGSRR